jgi:thiamine-monophosphate kinase
LAEAGLDSLSGRVNLSPTAKKDAERKHLRPEPRVEIGKQLRESGVIHACIDTSDSLAISFYHIAAAQNLGAEIDAGALPISVAAHEAAAQLNINAYEYALEAGEDFELLVAVGPDDAGPTINIIENADCRGSIIGKITRPEKGVNLSIDGGLKPISAKGFSHF